MDDHVLGTDNGPTCVRCSGTVWRYRFRRYGSAECVSCGMIEGPLRLREGRTLPAPRSAQEARKIHEDFRQLLRDDL
jgi:hypothetical protein